MLDSLTRRELVTQAARFGALATLGDPFFSAVFGAPANGHPGGRVPLASDIEPLARLIEDTPRDRIVETIAAKIRSGTGPLPLWTAALLAGARGVEPRPVGFKFHAVLVVNSAAQASLEAEKRDGLLPLFWTIDNFKDAQAKNAAEGGWYLKALAPSSLPSVLEARAQFVQAMAAWDEAKAEHAIATLYHTAGANAIAELFFHYGARDFRDIGHKAIYVANAWRILGTLGWRHAEPVLRSLVLALLYHEGQNPAHGDDEADRPYRANVARLGRFREGWQTGKDSPEATRDLWATLRSASWNDACEKTLALSNAGISPQSLWDAFHLRGVELLAQQPGIFGIHCVTSANALRFAFDAARDDETRKLLLLQQAAFLVLFRETMKAHPLNEKLRLDALEPLAPSAAGEDAVREIFSDLGSSREKAARKTLSLLSSGPSRAEEEWERHARHLVCNKATGAHDFKFSTAALEDAAKISPAFRATYRAGAMYDLMASTLADGPVARAAKAALGEAPR